MLLVREVDALEGLIESGGREVGGPPTPVLPDDDRSDAPQQQARDDADPPRDPQARVDRLTGLLARLCEAAGLGTEEQVTGSLRARVVIWALPRATVQAGGVWSGRGVLLATGACAAGSGGTLSS